MKTKAIARLGKELKAVQDELPPGVIDMFVCDSNLHELFFAVAGPEKTNFEGGVYVLKISLPKDYPYSPPDFFMFTPNGRFAPGAKICTSFSAFHPESWSPAYTINTLVVSFISFFSEENANAAGVVHDPPATRKRLASESVEWGRKSQYAKKLTVFSILTNGMQTDASLKEATAKIQGCENSNVQNRNGSSGSGIRAGLATAPSTSAAPASASAIPTGCTRVTSAHAAPAEPLNAEPQRGPPAAVEQPVKNKVAAASIDLTGSRATGTKKKRPASGSIDLTVVGASGEKTAKKNSGVVDLT